MNKWPYIILGGAIGFVLMFALIGSLIMHIPAVAKSYAQSDALAAAHESHQHAADAKAILNYIDYTCVCANPRAYRSVAVSDINLTITVDEMQWTEPGQVRHLAEMNLAGRIQQFVTKSHHGQVPEYMNDVRFVNLAGDRIDSL